MGRIVGTARTGAKAVAVGKDRAVVSQRRVQAPGVRHLRPARAVRRAAVGRVSLPAARVVVLRPCCTVPVDGGANEFHYF